MRRRRQLPPTRGAIEPVTWLAIDPLTWLAIAPVGLTPKYTAWAGTLLLSAAAAVGWLEVPQQFRWLTAEIGAASVLAAVQRSALFTDDARPDVFWVVQWYVCLSAVLAGLRYYAAERAQGRVRLGIAAGILSFSSLGTALTGSQPQQLWVLLAYAALLASGLLLAERGFVWWGAAGVAACVMWALRSYAFALLAVSRLR